MARYNYGKYRSGGSEEESNKPSGRYNYSKYKSETPSNANTSVETSAPITQESSQVEVNKQRLPTDYPGGYLNPVNLLNAARNTTVGSFVDRFAQSGGKVIGLKPEQMSPAASTGNKVADTIANVAGGVSGYFVNPGNLSQGPTTIYRATEPIFSKIGSKIPSIGEKLTDRGIQEAIKQAGTGAAYAVPHSLMQGDVSPESIAQNVAIEGMVGGGVGMLGPFAGAAAKNVAGKFESTKIGQAFSDFLNRGKAAEPQQEVLALPAPRERGNVNTAQTPDVINIPETGPRGLPEPDIAPATRARIETRPRENPYTQQLEDFFASARDMDAPPESLRGIWERTAGPNEPRTLDELIDLAYPSNRVSPNLASRAREYQRSREVAGVPMPVRTMSDRYPQGGVTGAVDAPVTQISRSTNERQAAAQLTKSVQPDVEIVAPQRNFAPTSQAAPRRTAPIQQERGFVTTIKESPKTAAEVSGTVNSTYKRITNAGTVLKANKRIDKDMEEAANYVLGNSRLSPDKVATGLRLIDEFTKQGNHARAVSIVEKMAPELTQAGQSLQAVSMYDRLSPNGVLLYAQRVAQKANEKIPATAKEIKVTPEMSADLTNLATVSKKMTGVKDLSNNVIDILERAKAGEKLSDADQQTVKQFVNEARQFVKETNRKPTVKPPKQPNDKRVRDNVVSFLNAQEQAAKERLRSRGITISSTPLDVYADYAIIGAAKMAQGVVKFADWSEQMVKELGEDIRPYMQSLYERSVQAFNQSTKQVSQETISQAERITERIIKSKNIQGDEAKYLRDLAQKVSRLSGDAKNVASQDLQAILQGLERSSFLQKISTAQTLAQLLNPKTLLTRNPLGNELFYRLERLNKYMTTPLDMARSKITGSDRTVTFRTNNQGEYWKNFVKGAIAGWKGVNPEGLATQFDIRPQTFNAKWNPLRYMEKALGASLKSFDYAAYRRAVNETVGELATLRALNEGQGKNKELIQKYIREADDNILNIADEYGRYITFQDNNIISTGLQALKRGLNLKKDFGVGDLVLKYPKTPGALLMRSLEYSPAGFLKSAYTLAKPYLRRGEEPNPREAMHALSRAITGTVGLTGLGYFLADKGILTGQSSKDKDVRELQKKAGQGQYQVNLSALKRWVQSGFEPAAAKIKEGDQLYTYDWAQPVAVSLSIGANIKQSITDKESKGKAALGVLGTGYESLAGGVNTLTEQSVLQGLKQAVEGYPGQTVTDKITSVLSDVPASFVPTAFNQANQLMDNTKRETYDPSKLQQSINRLKVKIPGLSQQLPQQFDTLGRGKEVYPDGSNNLFNVLLNPGYAAKYNLTPEAKLVVDLINATGDTSVAPRVPGKSITVKLPGGKSESQKLTPDQFSRIQQLTGEETQKRLQRINPNMSNDAKIKAVTKALTEAGERARTQLKREMGVR